MALSLRATILVVEDDAALRDTLHDVVGEAGFAVSTAADGAEAVRALAEHEFDVVLLDIGLPFVDGWGILATMPHHRIPSVIVISARGDEDDKVRALDMGADDYLAKPFGAGELLARIRAVLRRSHPSTGKSGIVSAGSITMDLEARRVLRNGVEVRLSPTEYVLLAELAAHAGKALDHRTLLRRVWGPEYGDERNYLHQFVQRLRSKLEDDPHHPEVIETIQGIGYRFVQAPPLA